MNIIYKFYNKLKLEGKIIFVFVPAVIFIIVFISYFSGEILTRVLVKRTINSETEKLVLISKEFQLIVDDFDDTIKIISQNPLLQQTLKSRENSDIRTFQKNMNKLSEQITGTYGFIDNITVISSDGKVYKKSSGEVYYDNNVLKSDIYKDASNKKGSVVIYDSHRSESDYIKSEETVINAGKAIIDVDTGKQIGIIYFDINESMIAKMYKNIPYSKDGRYYILNRAGYVLSSSDEKNIYYNAAGDNYFQWVINHNKDGRVFDVYGKKALITSIGLKDFDWYLISYIPVDVTIADNDEVTNFIYLTSVICIILIVCIAVVFAENLANPIKKLVDGAKKVSSGDMNTYIETNSSDEIGELANHFNIMVEKVNELIIKNKNEQKKKRKYELSLLQSQIKPHFLYNTLESVRSLILTNNNRLAFNTITNLGNFYKDVLNGGNSIITIEKEVKLTVNYMKIQQVRHEGMFNFNIDIDEKILEGKILKLTLQPIVENSVNHGFRGSKIKGMILIKGYKSNDKIIIELIDNGRGIDENKVKNILDLDYNSNKSEGYGLRNINERLKLQFGESYGISITSTAGVETKVVVSLPFAAEEEIADD